MGVGVGIGIGGSNGASGWRAERSMSIRVLAHEFLGPLSIGEMTLEMCASSTSISSFSCPLGVHGLVVVELIPDGIPILANAACFSSHRSISIPHKSITKNMKWCTGWPRQSSKAGVAVEVNQGCCSVGLDGSKDDAFSAEGLGFSGC